MPLTPSGTALFAGSGAEFIRMAPESSLTSHLVTEFNRRWGTTTDSEVRSWRNSLTALAAVAGRAGVDQAGVGVELKLPLTDKRIDVSFVARNKQAEPSVLLVELKQWESAAPSLYPDCIIVGADNRLHPSVQAAAYATYLRESHSAFTEHGYELKACAYLHNMHSADAQAIRQPEHSRALQDAPVFLRGDEPGLADLLAERVGAGDGMSLLPELVHGRYSPSKRLIEGIARSLRESPVWTLLDEQRLAFSVVRGRVQQAVRTGEKCVVLVVGGPGTGKSVIAAHLVVALAQDGGVRVAHATGSKAFTTNLRAVYPGQGAEAVFRYFNSFRQKATRENELDALVCDEAHRIRLTSNDRYTKTALRSEISQVRELIRAARVSVFLLDERQNVRPEEIGTVDAIAVGAAEEGVSVSRIDLSGQFRCSGCSGYIEWVDRLLSNEPARPGNWLAGGEYDLRVLSTPADLERAIVSASTDGNTGRLVAGFCWPWSDLRPDGSLVKDVVIGAWRRAWNEKSPEQSNPPRAAPRADRHPYYLWATQPERIQEVGCIYSAQGFEFDYCGVILGDDLVWRDGIGWVATREASFDPSIRRRKLDTGRLSALLHHTYRVLLTRGMKGTFMFSTDPETLAFLQRLVAVDA
jgi:DUF2075 family protein/Mrp family chromosome partitioning ATPase